VYGGLNRLLAAAFVAGVVVFAAPTAALACSGGPSAYNVYHECLSNGGSGGGGRSGGGGGGSGTSPTGGSQSSSSSSSSPAPPAVSMKAKKVLSHAGKDKSALKSLYRNNDGATRFLYLSHSAAPASQPSAIGSALDLGAGPTALLIALAGTAVLLLAMTGVRGARRRR
jgi:chitin-binding protein